MSSAAPARPAGTRSDRRGLTLDAGRRPIRSSSRRPGVASITVVKLTFSLARVSAVSAASRPASLARAGIGSHGRQAEHRAQRVGAGVAEHRPLAEVRGQYDERRAGGHCCQSCRVAPTPPVEQPQDQTGLERPAGAEVQQVDEVRRRRDDSPGQDQSSRRVVRASAAATSPVAPMPTILTAPLVSSPCRNAPR